MVQSSQSNWKQKLITQIAENEFLIEGYSQYARLKFENDHSILTSVEFSNGPLLHIGDNFLGHGKIYEINLIENDEENYMIFKIKVQ